MSTLKFASSLHFTHRFPRNNVHGISRRSRRGHKRAASMNALNDWRGHDRDTYIPHLFEAMTKNVGFGRKVMWLNRDECQHLLPQLRSILFGRFATHILNAYQINTKYCNVLKFMVTVNGDLQQSSRRKTICSPEYRLRINSKEDIVLHCRYFKQFSKAKQEEMFNLYFGIKSMPKHISQLKMYRGVAIKRIAFEQWKYSHLTHKKMVAGGALFEMDSVEDIESLEVTICAQIWSVIDREGNIIEV